jgi:hypothetical protein
MMRLARIFDLDSGARDVLAVFRIVSLGPLIYGKLDESLDVLARNEGKHFIEFLHKALLLAMGRFRRYCTRILSLGCFHYAVCDADMQIGQAWSGRKVHQYPFAGRANVKFASSVVITKVYLDYVTHHLIGQEASPLLLGNRRHSTSNHHYCVVWCSHRFMSPAGSLLRPLSLIAER